MSITVHNKDMYCANCGVERTGPYCAQCGQNDRDYQRALPPVLSELLRETFEVDSRLFRTLKLLIFKPGELACEFSRNRRARYVSPIRLYLFVSIAFFFLLSAGTATEPESDSGPVVIGPAEEVADTDTGRLFALLAEDAAGGVERIRRAQEILAREDASATRLLLLQIAKAINEEGDAEVSATLPYLVGEAVDALYEPGSVVRQFMDNLAAGMLIMLPVYALLLKLFYPRRKRFYVENLVFSTHLHTFFFLIFMADMLVSVQTGINWLDSTLDLASSLLSVWLWVYQYLALRRYYQEGRLRTLVKYTGLLTLYFLMLMPTAFLVVLAVTVIQI